MIVSCLKDNDTSANIPEPLRNRSYRVTSFAPYFSRKFSTVLFFPMQLLREVVGNAQFLDGMKLSVQEVRVPFFVLEHRLK